MNAKLITKIIKEELQKLLILEKFQSSKLTGLYKLFGRWSEGKQIFDKMARAKGFDWANVKDKDVKTSSSGDADSNVLNIYVVTKQKKNNTSKGGWYSLSPGLLGITVGNKIAASNGNLTDKGNRAGAGYETRGIWNFKQYNTHADVVYQIDMTKIPSAKDAQAARVEAKKGATALLNARDVLQANKRRYDAALTMKAGAGGWKSAREYVKRAHETLGNAIDINTKMLSSGKYASGWDSHYSLATRLYENILKEFQNFQEQNKAYLKYKAKADASRDYGSYNKDRMDQAIKNMKDYYNDFDKRMKRVLAEKPKTISTGY